MFWYLPRPLHSTGPHSFVDSDFIFRNLFSYNSEINLNLFSNFLPFRSTSMERRTCCLLVELGSEGVFIGMCEHWTIFEDAWTRCGRTGPWRFLGNCTTIHRWYSLGAFIDLTKRYVSPANILLSNHRQEWMLMKNQCVGNGMKHNCANNLWIIVILVDRRIQLFAHLSLAHYVRVPWVHINWNEWMNQWVSEWVMN